MNGSFCLLVNWSETLAEIRRFDAIYFYFLTTGSGQEFFLWNRIWKDFYTKSRKNPDGQKIVKNQNFFLYFLKVFQIFVENPRDIPKKLIPIPEILRFSRFSTQDFLGIFSGFPNPNPDPRDFGIFGISHSGFFRGFKILILIPEVSGFSGFFDLAQNKKSRSWIPGIGIRDTEKIPSRSQLWKVSIVNYD